MVGSCIVWLSFRAGVHVAGQNKAKKLPGKRDYVTLLCFPFKSVAVPQQRSCLSTGRTFASVWQQPLAWRSCAIALQGSASAPTRLGHLEVTGAMSLPWARRGSTQTRFPLLPLSRVGQRTSADGLETARKFWDFGCFRVWALTTQVGRPRGRTWPTASRRNLLVTSNTSAREFDWTKLLVPSISVIHPGRQKNDESLQRDASCESSRQHRHTRSAPVDKVRGHLHTRAPQVPEHASGSKGDSEPNLHRLTDKTSIGSRTVQQSRIVVATRFPSEFLRLPPVVAASVTETPGEKCLPPQEISG